MLNTEIYLWQIYLDSKMGFSECVWLFSRYGGSEYLIGESITQLQHALQAARIATICGAPEYIIIGLLLHDIGQLIGQDKQCTIDTLHEQHDDLGAEWLHNEGFPLEVIHIAKYHTLAKVLLCDRNASYLNTLSTISQHSYLVQKRKHANSSMVGVDVDSIMACRLIDDMAKIPNLTIGKLSDYEFMYDRVCHEEVTIRDNSDKKAWIMKVSKLFEIQVQNPNALIFML